MLLAVVENLEDVDEPHRVLYRPGWLGGTSVFMLDVHGIDAHPQVVNLKSALERVKAERNALRDENDELLVKIRRVPRDFDPDEWRRLKAGEPPVPRDMQELLAGKQAAEVRATVQEERATTLQAQLDTRSVDHALAPALIDAGLRVGVYIEACIAMLRKEVEVNVLPDGKRELLLHGKPIPEAIAEWATTQEGKAFMPHKPAQKIN